MAGRGALFLDWGGTLVRVAEGRTVLDGAGDPLLNPNVASTLARLRPGFAACFIVSNQARIARGEIDEAEVLRRFARIDARLGRPFTDWQLCPHQDGDGCACRKPAPGMFLALAARHGVDLSASTHVGDSDRDRDAAAAAGVGRFVRAAEFFGW